MSISSPHLTKAVESTCISQQDARQVKRRLPLKFSGPTSGTCTECRPQPVVSLHSYHYPSPDLPQDLRPGTTTSERLATRQRKACGVAKQKSNAPLRLERNRQNRSLDVEMSDSSVDMEVGSQVLYQIDAKLVPLKFNPDDIKISHVVGRFQVMPGNFRLSQSR